MVSGTERPAPEQPAPEQDAPERRADGQPPPSVDRRAYRRVLRAFRPRRVVPATLLSALLALAAILVAVEVIGQFVGASPVLPTSQLGDLGQDTAWNGALAVTVAVVAGLLGLLLLVLALVPGRARVVPLASGASAVAAGLTRSGLRRYAHDAAASVAGVTRVRARVNRRHRILLRVDTPLYEPGDLAEQVHQAVAARLGALAPVRLRRPRVWVRHREE